MSALGRIILSGDSRAGKGAKCDGIRRTVFTTRSTRSREVLKL